jgi:SAM-dependent methyltransferase
MASNAPNPLAMPATWDLVAAAYADEIVPVFERYAQEALERTGVTGEMRVVDVATGPGTLAVLAGKRGARVDALDFSAEMLAALRARLAREGLEKVTLHQGDGMALPFESQRYDAAFSMFGLFMFTDRARGFAELLRVLRPGGRAAVSSWQPFDRAPMLQTLFVVLKELLPDLPLGDAKGPLTDRDEFAAEMKAAGFRDVDVREVTHSFSAATTDEFVASLERTCAPIALLSHKMGSAWKPVRERLHGRFVERVGNGPHEVVMPAWLGIGTR